MKTYLAIDSNRPGPQRGEKSSHYHKENYCNTHSLPVHRICCVRRYSHKLAAIRQHTAMAIPLVCFGFGRAREQLRSPVSVTSTRKFSARGRLLIWNIVIGCERAGLFFDTMSQLTQLQKLCKTLQEPRFDHENSFTRDSSPLLSSFPA